jgi:DNA-binding NtrC family response regulator
VIAATNRDLGREMREGRFREDLYYRLCADTIVAPSLRERLADSPDELTTLLEFLAERLVGEQEAPVLAREAGTWIAEHLGRDYAWPGNVRELSHCVSNVLIHRNYRPAATGRADAWQDRLVQRMLGGELQAEDLLRSYCTLVYARTGSYVEAASRLGLDRRTVKSRVDPELLAELRGAR